MYESSAARLSDEQDVSAGDTLLDAKAEHGRVVLTRVALRDRLILRVLEEEFLGCARAHGEEMLYLVGFEIDAKRIWNRLGFDFRFNVIRDRIERINRLKELALTSDERMGTFDLSEFFGAFLMGVRHDWKRGKIKQRAEQRRRREVTGQLNSEDLLWRQICK